MAALQALAKPSRAPSVAHQVENNRGPVLVTIEYSVRDDERLAFLAHVNDLGHELRSDGCDSSPPADMCCVRPGSYLLSRLRGLHSVAGRLASTAPDVLSHPEISRALEEALTRVMIRCQTEGERTETAQSVRNHSLVMAKLEELLATQHDRALYLSETGPRRTHRNARFEFVARSISGWARSGICGCDECISRAMPYCWLTGA